MLQTEGILGENGKPIIVVSIVKCYFMFVYGYLHLFIIIGREPERSSVHPPQLSRKELG